MIYMATLKLRIKDFVAPGDHSHVGRSVFSEGRKVPFHEHDFAEVFWVETGRGMHLRNGEDEDLRPGVLCFIKPEDRHGFAAKASDGLAIMNVAFRKRVVMELAERYGEEFSPWPWAGASGMRVALDPELTQRLTRWAQDLAGHPESRVRLDRFLIDVLTLTRVGASGPVRGETGPEWLEKARRGFCSPEQFAGGVAAFAGLAGRSPEHVNRTLRTLWGVSTTQLINEIRLEWARRQLQLTDDSVTSVAMEAGFENISYFIRIFKGRYGLTPQAYRGKNRGPLPMG